MKAVGGIASSLPGIVVIAFAAAGHGSNAKSYRVKRGVSLVKDAFSVHKPSVLDSLERPLPVPLLLDAF